MEYLDHTRVLGVRLLDLILMAVTLVSILAAAWVVIWGKPHDNGVDHEFW